MSRASNPSLHISFPHLVESLEASVRAGGQERGEFLIKDLPRLCVGGRDLQGECHRVLIKAFIQSD